jgi:peptide/nickel transport system ATP-binding protein
VLRHIRGNRIGMIFQEPMTALNPVHSIGDQVAEPMRLHRGCRAAAHAARPSPCWTGWASPTRRPRRRLPAPVLGRAAPAHHHRDGAGLRPDLLIADEPTTALDVTIQQQILDLIQRPGGRARHGLMLISHDLGVIAQNVRRMMVMYGGSVVESGPTTPVFRHMAHPYTRGLFGARPRLGDRAGQRLTTIAGTVPELVDLPAGCAFADRCAWAQPPATRRARADRAGRRPCGQLPAPGCRAGGSTGMVAPPPGAAPAGRR